MSKHDVLRMLKDLEVRVESADEFELQLIKSAIESGEATISCRRVANDRAVSVFP